MSRSLDRNLWEILRRKVLPTTAIREIDRRAIEDYSMNSLVLMENAAVNCVQWIRSRYLTRPKTVVLCGRGNNGGDGIAIARHLRSYGWPCDCFVMGKIEDLSPDARSNASILARPESGLHLLEPAEYGNALPLIASAELIVDAMLGTGAQGDPRPPMASWIDAANNCSASKIAIDIPSGVNADTGQVGASYFTTQATLTFVALKPAMALPALATLFGDIEVLPIGIPEKLILELTRE